MKLKDLMAILVLVLLIACTPEEKQKNVLSSGVQYLGEQEKILSELKTLSIDYKNPPTINLDLKDYKLIIIEPNYLKKISEEQLLQALQEKFFVFFIHLEDSRLVREHFFNTAHYDEKKRDKVWAEQWYLENDQLKSNNFSTDANIEDDLLMWLQYFDQYKLESK